MPKNRTIENLLVTVSDYEEGNISLREVAARVEESAGFIEQIDRQAATWLRKLAIAIELQANDEQQGAAADRSTDVLLKRMREISDRLLLDAK